jgi:hypothetical protein
VIRYADSIFITFLNLNFSWIIMGIYRGLLLLCIIYQTLVSIDAASKERALMLGASHGGKVTGNEDHAGQLRPPATEKTKDQISEEQHDVDLAHSDEHQNHSDDHAHHVPAIFEIERFLPLIFKNLEEKNIFIRAAAFIFDLLFYVVVEHLLVYLGRMALFKFFHSSVVKQRPYYDPASWDYSVLFSMTIIGTTLSLSYLKPESLLTSDQGSAIH